MSESTSSQGLFASLKRMADTAIRLAENRLELFVVELQEEKTRVIHALMWACAALFLAAMALIVLTFALVVVFWDHVLLRFVMISVLFVAYAGGAAFCYWMLRGRLAAASAPFQSTLQEFKKDRACLNVHDSAN
jgi:uncharacterized membrane protein YqjE